MKIENNDINPFLRWAGGKKWLTRQLDAIVSKPNFNSYHEPFLGGASLFFSINQRHKSFLSDLNKELIDTYITLRDFPEELIRELSTYKNEELFYYQIRSIKSIDPIKQAARFIYLNQTSYNGIFRVNLKGEYNVPYGFRTKNFFDPALLREVSVRLYDCQIFYGDFADTLDNVSEGDLVYLDPPYTVSHNNNGFIKYNQKLFSIEDQVRLSKYIDSLKDKGAYYILSNACHPKIHEIFDKNDTILELKRASLIGGKNASRGKISEFLFTNINSHSND